MPAGLSPIHNNSGKKNCGPLRHGHCSGGKISPTYHSWAAMIQRCTDIHTKAFKNYGARGIRVCHRWTRFDNFLSDMGEKPHGYTIERIDNSKGYEPGNCKWATRFEQGRNKRNNRVFTVYGKSGCLVALSEQFGISWKVVQARIDRLGWDTERAFTTRTAFRVKTHRHSDVP